MDDGNRSVIERARRFAKGVSPCLLFLSLLFASCRNDMEKVLFFDDKDIPTQSLDSVRVVRSAKGHVQMVMMAPSVVMHSKPVRKTEYKDGVVMHLLNSDASPLADIRADYAVSFDDEKRIVAQRNVVIIDYGSGDTSYLETVTWNQGNHTIFSDDPVKSVNGQRVTYGDGFTSDEDFVEPHIIHQRGTLTVDD